jgi:hypothetical protein
MLAREMAEKLESGKGWGFNADARVWRRVAKLADKVEARKPETDNDRDGFITEECEGYEEAWSHWRTRPQPDIGVAEVLGALGGDYGEERLSDWFLSDPHITRGNAVIQVAFGLLCEAVNDEVRKRKEGLTR